MFCRTSAAIGGSGRRTGSGTSDPVLGRWLDGRYEMRPLALVS
jgi:hypothetical protein